MSKSNPQSAAGNAQREDTSTSLPKANTADGTVGNFLLGESFADIKCRHGHETRLFNIGRDHFVACDSCRTFVHVGSNLMSSWRRETKDVWQANHESVQGYEFIE